MWLFLKKIISYLYKNRLTALTNNAMNNNGSRLNKRLQQNSEIAHSHVFIEPPVAAADLGAAYGTRDVDDVETEDV